MGLLTNSKENIFSNIMFMCVCVYVFMCLCSLSYEEESLFYVDASFLKIIFI